MGSLLSFSIVQGETAVKSFADTSTEDRTNWSFAMDIRKTPDSTSVAWSGTDTNYISLSTTGVIEASFDDEDAAAIPAGVLCYDLFGTSTTGVVSRLFYGSVNVAARITR